MIRNETDALPEITSASSIGDCLLALLVTQPTPEEVAYTRAQISGGPVSPERAAKAAKMKARQDIGLRLTSFRPSKRLAA